MGKLGQVEFTATLNNEASVLFKQIGADAEKAMSIATAAAEKHGNAVNKLTDYIKAERTEQRQQNFLFKQTQETVQGAASVLALYGNTLGQSSEEMKKVTNSLNAGYVAFQGVNNVVGLLSNSFTFLAGPWGIIISLTAAAAVAISQFTNDTADSNEELKKYKGLLEDIKKLEKDAFGQTTSLEDVLVAKAKMEDAWQKYMEGITGKRNKMGMLIKAPVTTEEAAQLYKDWLSAKITLDKINNEFNQFLEEGKSGESIPIRIHVDEASALGVSKAIPEFIDNGVKAGDKKILLSGSITAKQWLDQWDKAEKLKLAIREKAIEDAEAREQAALQNYQQSSMQVFQLVGSALGASLAGKDAAARDVLKNIANMFITMAESALFAATAMANAKSIMTFWTSMIADAPLLVAGFAALEGARAMVNSMHTGGVVGRGGAIMPLQGDEHQFILQEGEAVIPRSMVNNSSSSSSTIFNATININAPGTPKETIVGALKQFVRETGMSIDKLFVNDSSGISVAY